MRENSDSCRHSTKGFSKNIVVARTSYQMSEVLSFCYRERASFSINIRTNVFGEKKERMKLSGVSFFENTPKN